MLSAVLPFSLCLYSCIQNRKNCQDQLGAMGMLCKVELRLVTGTPNRIVKAFGDIWRDIVSEIALPTPHFDPLFDVLLTYALCRAGRTDDAEGHLQSMKDFAQSQVSTRLYVIACLFSSGC